MRTFWIGLALGVVGTAIAAAWFVKKVEDEPVMFPGKSVYDGGDSYHFEGSIYGTGEDAPVNNFISAWCFQATMECEVTTIDDLSSAGFGNFVGSPFEDRIKVRSWGEREIVADSHGKDPKQCNWYEIKIDRATEEIAYTRIPNKNPDRVTCEGLTPKVFRWRIDNGKAHLQDDDGTMRN